MIRENLFLIRNESTKYELPPDSEFSLVEFMNRNFMDFYMYRGTMLNVACVKDVIFFDLIGHLAIRPDFVKKKHC